jgi:hypothetical protein
MKTKSQFKIQQMAFMILGVFIFFVLVGLLFIVMESQKWKDEANTAQKDMAVELANVLASSAEFSCGAYCVDADRLMSLVNKTAYKDFWGLDSIEVRTVYPANTKEILCNPSNYPNCNYIKILKKGNGQQTASSFVSLCKRINEKNYIYFKCDVAKILMGYSLK